MLIGYTIEYRHLISFQCGIRNPAISSLSKNQNVNIKQAVQPIHFNRKAVYDGIRIYTRVIMEANFLLCQYLGSFPQARHYNLFKMLLKPVEVIFIKKGRLKDLDHFH